MTKRQIKEQHFAVVSALWNHGTTSCRCLCLSTVGQSRPSLRSKSCDRGSFRSINSGHSAIFVVPIRLNELYNNTKPYLGALCEDNHDGIHRIRLEAAHGLPDDICSRRDNLSRTGLGCLIGVYRSWLREEQLADWGTGVAYFPRDVLVARIM